MKVIFLDIDGVLNCLGEAGRTTQRTPDGFIGIDPNKVSLLRKITDATSAQIVLSSTWRCDKKSRQYVRDALATQNLNFISCAEDFSTIRGLEISKWLDAASDIESFVILDDDTDMAHLSNKLVHTDFRHGLTEKDVQMAIEILNMVAVV